MIVKPEKFNYFNGLPQGSVLSPLLFLWISEERFSSVGYFCGISAFLTFIHFNIGDNTRFIKECNAIL